MANRDGVSPRSLSRTLWICADGVDRVNVRSRARGRDSPIHLESLDAASRRGACGDQELLSDGGTEADAPGNWTRSSWSARFKKSRGRFNR